MTSSVAIHARACMVVLATVLGVACLDATVGLGGGGRPGDAALRDAGDELDATVAPDAGTARDASADPCACDGFDPTAGPTHQFHSCVPPLEIGCPATVCTPGNDACGPGYTCETCGAAACCMCAACVPACVFTGPEQGPLPEYLKLRSTLGPAGQEHEIAIEGFPFFIGALFYVVRMGDSDPLFEVGQADPCRLVVRVPARGPGMLPIWVSQYGGDEPWVLAGFFTYDAGAGVQCTQPGYSCGEGLPCCTTRGVAMSCQAGRCRRQ